MANHYVVEVDETAPSVRLVAAKTRNGALQFIAAKTITVRLASASDVYDLARKGVEVEDSTAAEPTNAVLPFDPPAAA